MNGIADIVHRETFDMKSYILERLPTQHGAIPGSDIDLQ